MIFEHIHIVDPRSSWHGRQADVWIEEGHFREIGDLSQVSAEVPRLRAEGAFLSPGWVDMLAITGDPGFEHKESLAQLAQAAAAGGFTRVLCHPHTHPAMDHAGAVQAWRQRAEGLPAELMLCGALSAKEEGKELAELYDMHLAGAAAFSDHAAPARSAGLLIRALQYSRTFGGLLIAFPYDRDAAGEGQMNEGEMSVFLGMKGIPELAEELPALRMAALLRYAPGRLHAQPISSPQALAALQASRRNEGLTVGVALPHLVFDDALLHDFDTRLKLTPPLRSPGQRSQLLEALKSGEIDVICSGHQPQGLEEKEQEFALAEPGMSSLISCFSLACEHLIEPGHLSLAQWVQHVSIAPRQILRLPEARIEKGMEAEITVFHPGQRWEYAPSMLPSRAKNDPSIGRAMQGAVWGIHRKNTWHPAQLQQ